MEATGTSTQNLDGKSGFARTVEQASSGAHHAIEKVSGAAHPAVDRLASGAHQAVDRLAVAAGHAAETISEKGEQLKAVESRAVGQCRDFVRDNPLTSLGIAAAVGFALSRLLKRH